MSRWGWAVVVLVVIGVAVCMVLSEGPRATVLKEKLKGIFHGW